MANKIEILNKLFSGTRQLPTLPVLLSEVMKLMENPFVSNKKISDLLMKDQAMVAKILKLSNSALYGSRQSITDLAQAITRLGNQTLRNLILQISMVRLFPFDEKDIPEFSAEVFWEHSLGTAYFTDILVKKLRIPPNDDFYIGGLLHDLGKLVIYQFYPEKFREIVLQQIRAGGRDYEVETAVLEVDHTDIGEYLALNWKFKKEIISAIREHHKHQDSPAMNVAIVRIANMFAKAADLCFPWDQRVYDIVGDPAWESLCGAGKQDIDAERITFEMQDESEKIKDSVRELLSKK